MKPGNEAVRGGGAEEGLFLHTYLHTGVCIVYIPVFASSYPSTWQAQAVRAGPLPSHNSELTLPTMVVAHRSRSTKVVRRTLAEVDMLCLWLVEAFFAASMSALAGGAPHLEHRFLMCVLSARTQAQYLEATLLAHHANPVVSATFPLVRNALSVLAQSTPMLARREWPSVTGAIATLPADVARVMLRLMMGRALWVARHGI